MSYQVPIAKNYALTEGLANIATILFEVLDMHIKRKSFHFNIFEKASFFDRP